MTFVGNRGPIALVGGDEFGPRCESVDRELLNLRPSTRLAVAVVPTAAAGQRPELAAANGTRYFESLGAEARGVMAELMSEAKAAGLWALGHPKEIGGQGLPFLDYVYVNEVVGRSEISTPEITSIVAASSITRPPCPR